MLCNVLDDIQTFLAEPLYSDTNSPQDEKAPEQSESPLGAESPCESHNVSAQWGICSIYLTSPKKTLNNTTDELCSLLKAYCNEEETGIYRDKCL